ncbi:HNH endonuclease family protein [Pseudomonas aeruginosa]|nr:HNH endonuclease family protein [Pseudomonas aeruginosa]
MPQTLSLAWREAMGEAADQHELFVNRWGNLTLLGGKLNITASNQPFAEKLALYRQSKIALSQALAAYEDWGLPEIEARQAQLAEIAEGIWRI